MSIKIVFRVCSIPQLFTIKRNNPTEVKTLFSLITAKLLHKMHYLNHGLLQDGLVISTPLLF